MKTISRHRFALLYSVKRDVKIEFDGESGRRKTTKHYKLKLSFQNGL